jgi:2,3-bisphosphoglycerate-dependent phosphoglycerate mutase
MQLPLFRTIFYSSSIAATFILLGCGGAKTTTTKTTEPEATVVPYTKPLPKVTAGGQVIFTSGSSVNIPDFQNPNATVFFIVRHAEKNTNQSDDVADLTPEGWGRAVAMTRILREVSISRVFSTNSPRCKSTATPMRQGKHLDLEIYDKNTQNNDLNQIVAKKGQRVFWVGHSNTVPQVLNYLTNSSDYVDIPSDDYSRLYIVSTTSVGRARVISVEF